jgi:hypothetical protein
MIWRPLARWLAPLLVATVCFLPAVHAQVPRRVPTAPEEGSHSGPLPWAVAFLSLIIIMVVVCMPSRKMEHKRD